MLVWDCKDSCFLQIDKKISTFERLNLDTMIDSLFRHFRSGSRMVCLLSAALVSCSAPTVSYCPDEARTSLDMTLAPQALMQQDPTLMLNELHPYICYADEDTPAPEGYKPFYISHYGRHGSRSMHTDATLVKVMDIMQPALEEDNLTPLGRQLYDTLMLVKAQTEGAVGRLTRLGALQHAGIATRMYARFPEVFEGDAYVSCISTVIPRCIMSMSNFNMALKGCQPNLDIRMNCQESYTPWMNAKEPDRIARVNKMVDKAYPLDESGMIARIFKQAPKNGKGFMNALFRTLAPGINLDKPVLGLNFFSQEELWSLWARYNVREYMNCSNPAEIGYERMRIFTPLIDTIVVCADRAIAAFACASAGNACASASACASDKPHAADLRFGHDYPLMTILSYFEPEGLELGLTMDQVNERFATARWISMASNLQLIFYRKSNGSCSVDGTCCAAAEDILVKVLHNEGEVKLQGLTPVSGPYYKWSDLRQALLTRADQYRNL